MEGILNLIKSKNPPVFNTPLRINYTEPPVKGEAFLFTRGGLCGCNLSVVKKITRFDGFMVIQTLNSYYTLRVREEK